MCAVWQWNARGYNFHFHHHWRHNERDSVSNHRHLDCLLNRLFRRRSKSTPKLYITGRCEGNSTVTGHMIIYAITSANLGKYAIQRDVTEWLTVWFGRGWASGWHLGDIVCQLTRLVSYWQTHVAPMLPNDKRDRRGVAVVYYLPETIVRDSYIRGFIYDGIMSLVLHFHIYLFEFLQFSCSQFWFSGVIYSSIVQWHGRKKLFDHAYSYSRAIFMISIGQPLCPEQLWVIHI